MACIAKLHLCGGVGRDNIERRAALRKTDIDRSTALKILELGKIDDNFRKLKDCADALMWCGSRVRSDA